MIFQRLERARLTDENYNVLICEKTIQGKIAAALSEIAA